MNITEHRTPKDPYSGNTHLTPETAELIKSLVGTTSEPTLIPYINYGIERCVDEYIGFCDDPSIRKAFQLSEEATEYKAIDADFIEAEITEKYHTILLTSPLFHQHKMNHREENYIEKALDLLAPDGRLIAMISRGYLSRFISEDSRKKLFQEFSIKYVFDITKVLHFSSMKRSIIIIQKAPPTDSIRMITEETETAEIIKHYNDGTIGFTIPLEEAKIRNRIDPAFFDPKKKDVRELILDRDKKKLKELASSITSGPMFNPREYTDQGEYLVIQPFHLNDGKIELEDKRRHYITKETLHNYNRERAILKKDDLIISLIAKPRWAFYTGDEEYAVACRDVAIVRFSPENIQLIKLFLSTSVGREYIESQIKFLMDCSGSSVGFPRITVSTIGEISVPDESLIKYARQVQASAELKDRVAALFKDLGWTVENDFQGSDKISFDLALYHNGQIYGVVETKRQTRHQLAHATDLGKQLERIKAKHNNFKIFLFFDEKLYEYKYGCLIQLSTLPRPEDIDTPEIPDEIVNEKHKPDEPINVISKRLDDISIPDQAKLEIAQADNDKIDQILHLLQGVDKKIDTISDKIDVLSEKLNSYQSLVSRQLEYAESEAEKERILHSLADEVAEKTIQAIAKKDGNRNYDQELQNLIILFENTWDRLEESTKTFLVTAKLTFAQMKNMSNIMDYSGVCLLVTKALEVETGKRFCKGFVDFMKEKYPGKDYSIYSTGLLNQYGKPCRPKDYTLGSLAYILCYKKDDKATEEQFANNKAKLLEYARAKLFSAEKTDQDIINTLDYYAEEVEQIKNDYRNPAAHTNTLQRIKAQECIDLVIDVERILRKMLESFIR